MRITGGLARAVGSHEPEQLALIRVEREAVKRDGRAAAAAEVDEPQHRSVGCSRYRFAYTAAT
jgi:hypothetical protein